MTCLNPHQFTATLAAALALCAASAGHAGVITTTGVLSEQGNTFLPAPSDDTSSEAFVRAPGPLESFTFDFSAAGDVQWTVTWQAPPGQFFEITPPSGAHFMEITFEFNAGANSNPGGFFDRDFGVDVQDVPGSPALPVTNEQALLSGLGETGVRFTANVFGEDLVPGQTYRFTSVTSTVTIPAGYDVNRDSPVNRFQIIGRAGYPDASAQDPGQWIHIVPEPTSLALLGLGGLLVVRRRTA